MLKFTTLLSFLFIMLTAQAVRLEGNNTIIDNAKILLKRLEKQIKEQVPGTERHALDGRIVYIEKLISEKDHITLLRMLPSDLSGSTQH